MASEAVQPGMNTQKRKRKESGEAATNVRILEINISKYPSWVGKQSDEELIKIFDIGVAASKSITMNIAGNEEHFGHILDKVKDTETKLEEKITNDGEKHCEKVLKLVRDMETKLGEKIYGSDKQFKEIQTTLEKEFTKNVTGGDKQYRDILQQFQNAKLYLEKKMMESSTKSKDEFSKVWQQVKDTQTELEKILKEGIKPIEDKLNEITGKSVLKGALGEMVVISELRKALPQHTFTDVSKQGGCGDIHVSSPVSEGQYLVEVKTQGAPVNARAIEKFEKNVKDKPDLKVGIMLSLNSGISRRATYGKFQITYQEGHYYIYAPNAKEENLIVWSVLLADELAKLDRGLTETQTQEIQKLQQKFVENMAKSSSCRKALNSLQASVSQLEKDLVPLLDIIDETKKALNKVLNQ